MEALKLYPKGRGTAENPASRFVKIDYEADDTAEAHESGLKTVFYEDASQTILARNNSPDIPFDVSINPYRGCEHGCVYCYARPTHEYFELSAGLDFESKIFVKRNAGELLRKQLMAKRWVPQTIGISGVTDPYQPAEKHFRITRSCLQVLAEFRNPVGIVTKNHMVTRDIDYISELAENQAAMVALSITTLDGELARRMEPRASHPQRRLEAIRKLSAAGIPTVVMVAPVIPGLTDHEIPDIIAAAAEAGATHAYYVMLRLPYGIGDLFQSWLGRYYPDRKEKVLNRIRSMRDGKLNISQFHDRMRGNGVFADQINTLFKAACHRAGLGLDRPRLTLSKDAFRRPGSVQLKLF